MSRYVLSDAMLYVYSQIGLLTADSLPFLYDIGTSLQGTSRSLASHTRNGHRSILTVEIDCIYMSKVHPLNGDSTSLLFLRL